MILHIKISLVQILYPFFLFGRSKIQTHRFKQTFIRQIYKTIFPFLRKQCLIFRYCILMKMCIPLWIEMNMMKMLYIPPINHRIS